MASHWAIAIGISQYSYMDPLKYADRDVEVLQEYLTKANFDTVYCFSEQSPDLVFNGEVTLSMQPTFANLKRFLDLRFTTPFLQPDDTLWFFFIGHGSHYGNQDYLMPADGHPNFADSTALSIDSITQYLRNSGTEKIVLVLDACHTETQQFGQGFGTDPNGVITLFSSDYGQISRKLDGLKHGSFTCALLDGLQTLSKYQNATIEHLYLLLKDTLPKLNRRSLKPPQNPRLRVDPSLSTAMIQIPPTKLKSKNWLQGLFLPDKLKSPGMTGAPALVASESQQPAKILAIAGLTGAVICAGVIGYLGLQKPNRSSPSAPSTAQTKMNLATARNSTKTPTQPKQMAPTRMVPNRPDQEAGLGEIPSERSPRPGVYYTTNPQFTASRREIGKSGDRLCIKLVNGSPNTAKGHSKVVVSSVSRRADGYYIDATGQKLSLGSLYSELSDGKLLWQRLETDVDESGLMGECLTAKTEYVKHDKPGG